MGLRQNENIVHNTFQSKTRVCSGVMRMAEEAKKRTLSKEHLDALARGRAAKAGQPHQRAVRPTRAIVRAKCIDCLGGYSYDCKSPDCPLFSVHPFRGRSIPETYRDLFDFDGCQDPDAITAARQRAKEAWEGTCQPGETFLAWMERTKKRPQEFFETKAGAASSAPTEASA